MDPTSVAESPVTSEATSADFVDIPNYQVLSSDGSEDLINGSDGFVNVRKQDSHEPSRSETKGSEIEMSVKSNSPIPKPEPEARLSKPDNSSKMKAPFFVTAYGTRVYDDDAWSVSFEQFLASALTEPALCEFFERKSDPTDAINRLRNRRGVDRKISFSVEGITPSPASTPTKSALK